MRGKATAIFCSTYIYETIRTNALKDYFIQKKRSQTGLWGEQQLENIKLSAEVWKKGVVFIFIFFMQR